MSAGRFATRSGADPLDVTVMAAGEATVVRGNARDIPLPDNSVDLIVTSPPYFLLRSYQDDGEHYDGQIGDEPTVDEFVDALLDVTRECMRVLKKRGSLWVNLGDKYGRGSRNTVSLGPNGKSGRGSSETVVPSGYPKSLIGVPWRYAIRCIDELGLTLRAEVIWNRPNALPESVTDRVRRSHETWFHFTLTPTKYYANIDPIREAHKTVTGGERRKGGAAFGSGEKTNTADGKRHTDGNPAGKLPGSVWDINTTPLRVPAELGIKHFAAFAPELPRRIILGWAPERVCTKCDQGRQPLRGTACTECDGFRPNNAKECPECGHRRDWKSGRVAEAGMGATDWSTPGHGTPRKPGGHASASFAQGEKCGCKTPDAPTRAAIVFDPFGGTGTTAMVAKALGRHGVSLDLSNDYCRLAQWRTNDTKQIDAVVQATREFEARRAAAMATVAGELSAAALAPDDAETGTHDSVVAAELLATVAEEQPSLFAAFDGEF